jgi:phage baseplate assembly protein W
MPATRQAVLLALKTVRGSSTALSSFGVKLPRKMGETFEAECRSAVTAALSHLINTNRIRLDSVTAEKGLGGRGRITVAYTDIATGKKAEPVTI